MKSTTEQGQLQGSMERKREKRREEINLNIIISGVLVVINKASWFFLAPGNSVG